MHTQVAATEAAHFTTVHKRETQEGKIRTILVKRRVAHICLFFMLISYVDNMCVYHLRTVYVVEAACHVSS